MVRPAGAQRYAQADPREGTCGESLKVLADPDMVQKFTTIGLEPVGSTGEQTREAIAIDIPKWGKVIKDAGIKVSR